MSPPDRLAGRPASRGLWTRLALPCAGLFALTLTCSLLLEHALELRAPWFVWPAGIGAAGVAVLVAGCWMASRGLTRSITALDDAVHRLRAGDYGEVPVTSNDEIGRLAASFNAMIGDLRDRESRLTHIALHDLETGLPNRLSLERLAGSEREAWVILFGIDRFESVRNAIGYDSMSRLISALGRRLAALADGASVARVDAAALGVVVIARDEAGALALAGRMSQAAQTPLLVDGAPVDIALTAGIARHGAGAADSASAVDRAAIAIEQARGARRPLAVFDPAAWGDPGGNLSLISELMAALDNGEFSLAYQPKYDLRAERIGGVEALARWAHPRRGLVPPDLFVGMAEETGHIRPLTEWVVRRALADQKVFAEAGHDVPMSINISGRLLSDESFADFALAEVQASDARLCFEITETAVMDNPELALGVIDRLSAAGIRVSLDDYGSGLSSLAYLKRIQADELKIDKTFVMGMDASARDALLVKSTIDLAHGLGLRVTAEGVETPTALALLRGMGCDMAQGYLIGRPLPVEELIARLEGPPVEIGGGAPRIQSA